jgi:hypothetical protein
MKIYFSGALTQKKQFGVYYKQIVAFLEKLGHEVFQDTTHTSFNNAVKKNEQERFVYYQQVLKWIKQADAVFLEVSFPSTLHIGHEVSLGIDQAKPVVALYHKGFEPSFFLGLDHDLVLWCDYCPHSLSSVLQRGVRFVQEKTQIRFNLTLSYTQYRYLQKVTQSTAMTKAAYIRKLIENDAGV